MPIITMTGPIISLEQKRELAQRLTKVASEVYQRSPSEIIVIIRENQPENVAIGGHLRADKIVHSAEEVENA